MANKEDIGPRITLSGEREFRQAIQMADKAISMHGSEMQKVSAIYTKNEKSVEALRSKTQVYSKIAAEQEGKIKLIRQALEKSNQAYQTSGERVEALKKDLKAAEEEMARMGTSADATTEDIEGQRKKIAELQDELKGAELSYESAGKKTTEWQTKLNKAEADLAKTKTSIADTSSELSKAESALQKMGDAATKAGDKISKVGTGFTNVGKKLTTGLTVPIVAAGTAAVKFAADFEQSGKKVETIADTTVMSMDELSDGILKISSETGEAATDLNEALYQVISATGDTANALDYVDIANKAAIGGFTDTATAVDGLTTVMNTYGLKGKESMEMIADQMLMAQNYGKTTFGELASGMGQVVPIASSLNISTEELMATMATLTKNGIGTSQAVTGLKAALSNIIKPSTEAGKAAEALGIDFSAANLQAKGLQGFLQEVQTALQNVAPEYAKAADRVTELRAKIAEAEQSSGAYAAQLSSEKNEVSGLRDERKLAAQELQKQIDAQQTYIKELRASKKSASSEEKALIDQQITQQSVILDSLKENKKASLEAIDGQIDAQSKAVKSMAAQGAAAGASKEQIAAWKKELKASEEQLELLEQANESTIGSFSTLFGSVEGLNSIMVLTSETGMKDMNGAMGAMKESAGATQKAADTMLDSLSSQAKKLKNDVKNLGIDIGRELLPLAQDLISGLHTLIQNFSKLDDGTKKNILRFGALAASVGPVVTVVGKVTTGIGGLTKGFGKAVTGTANFIKGMRGITPAAGESIGAAGKLGGALSAIGGGPVLLGIAAATAAIGGIAYAANESHKRVEEMRRAGLESIKGIADAYTDFQNRVAEADSFVDSFDLSTIFSAEQQQAVEDGIKNSQDRIIEIARLAAEKSRSLTDEEYKEITELVGLIDSYVAKKLEAYEQQQMIVEEKVRRGMYTDEEGLKSAEDTKNQRIEIAKQAWNEAYALAEEYNGKNESLRQEMLDKADADYKRQVSEAGKVQSDTVNIILDNYSKENKAAADQLSKLGEHYRKRAALAKEKAEIEAEIERRQREESAQSAVNYRNETLARWAELDQGISKESHAISNTAKQLDLDFAATWISMATQIEASGGQITSEQREIAQNIVEIFSDLPDDLKSEGEEAMKALGISLGSNGELLYTTAQGQTIKILQGFESMNLSEKAMTIGVDAIQGFIKGMNSQMQAAIGASTAVVQAAIDAARITLDSHSPSRVMRGLGVNAGEGFRLGLMDEIDAVDQTMRNLAAVPASVITSIGNMDRIASSVNLQTVTAKQTQPPAAARSSPMARIVIQLDGRTIGEAVTPVVSQKIKAAATAAARGRGISSV